MDCGSHCDSKSFMSYDKTRRYCRRCITMLSLLSRTYRETCYTTFDHSGSRYIYSWLIVILIIKFFKCSRWDTSWPICDLLPQPVTKCSAEPFLSPKKMLKHFIRRHWQCHSIIFNYDVTSWKIFRNKLERMTVSILTHLRLKQCVLRNCINLNYKPSIANNNCNYLLIIKSRTANSPLRHCLHLTKLYCFFVNFFLVLRLENKNRENI